MSRAQCWRARTAAGVAALALSACGGGSSTQLPAPRSIPLHTIDGAAPPLTDYIASDGSRGEIWGGALTGTPNVTPCQYRLDVRVVSASGQATVQADSGAINCTWIAPTHAEARFSLGAPWHQHQFDWVQP